ncbi:myeloid leukemia factor-like isoform X2 [Ischnura elegans]|uniref:myeloid leukemia factor-like isoform X2 n=1 Tax=Ischnura elegans TaxID=197161 RepID=UPI001ED89EEF|nr:myeloid leukemia factor-like isoform X2 [Ischnura elegans]
MDQFNLAQPPDDESFYMRMAAVNHMSQMMQSMQTMMMNPHAAAMGIDTSGIMGMITQTMLVPAVSMPILRPTVPANPWADMFAPATGSSFQSMSLMGGDTISHSYSSSTLMSMSTGPDGRPLVYQATSSTRSRPGGVCEVQKSVCDSLTGTKKMQIGRHIGNRGHVIEKEQNYISGEREEREDFINIEEDEAERFSEEFEYLSRVNGGNVYPRQHVTGQGSGDGEMLALPSSQQYMPAGRTTPNSGWTDGSNATNWYSNQSNVDVPNQSLPWNSGNLEKYRKRDHSYDEVGGPTSSKTPKTYLPSYENDD